MYLHINRLSRGKWKKKLSLEIALFPFKPFVLVLRPKVVTPCA